MSGDVRFTRRCRAIDADVVVLAGSGLPPICEESCTQGGACDDRPCVWSIANAEAAQARADLAAAPNWAEEWIANMFRVDFPFMVDYTETAWDPCSVSAVCDDGTQSTFMADREAVTSLDCSTARTLRDHCLSQTVQRSELVFAGLGISGYDDDPRGLFQIPEVVTWVQACEADLPDLAAWLHPSPNSTQWYAQAVFNALGVPAALELPVRFYQDWVQGAISAASRVLARAGVDGTSAQKIETSMLHKAGWALHAGWGTWFRSVRYDLALARQLWEQHRPLSSPEDTDFNLRLLDMIREQALAKEAKG